MSRPYLAALCILATLGLNSARMTAEEVPFVIGENVDIDCIDAINEAQKVAECNKNLLFVFLRADGGAVCDAPLPDAFFDDLGFAREDCGESQFEPLRRANRDQSKSADPRVTAMREALNRLWLPEEFPELDAWINSYAATTDLDALAEDILDADCFFWPLQETEKVHEVLEASPALPSFDYFIDIARMLAASTLRLDPELSVEQRLSRLKACQRMGDLLRNGPFAQCSVISGASDVAWQLPLRATGSRLFG